MVSIEENEYNLLLSLISNKPVQTRVSMDKNGLKINTTLLVDAMNKEGVEGQESEWKTLLYEHILDVWENGDVEYSHIPYIAIMALKYMKENSKVRIYLESDSEDIGGSVEGVITCMYDDELRMDFDNKKDYVYIKYNSIISIDPA